MVVIVGFGNPLLDITVKLPDETLLHKYNLNVDDQKEIPSSSIRSLLHDISFLKPSFSPGGAAQNTLRILQWVIEKPHSTVMFGAVGQDEQGATLKALVEAAGVRTCYVAHKDEPTGIVAALVIDANRSLAAYIGAALHVKMEHLQANHMEIMLKEANLVYMEGFFLTERQKVAQYIQNACQEHNAMFAFNLSAVYMAKTYPHDVLHFAEKCDILIGNKNEYLELISAANLEVELKTLVQKLTKEYDNFKNLKYGKIIIITDGSKSVMCVHSNGQVEEFVVPKIEASDIGDTTGAGDAFAAGFLAGLFAGRNPVGCLKWGCWVAGQIIRQTGCTIPKYSAEPLKNIE